jgi:hypothetical protein
MSGELQIVRPDDLLVGWVTFQGCGLAADGTAIVRDRSGEPAAVKLRLPAQHFSEAMADPLRALPGPESGGPILTAPRFVSPLLASTGARLEWSMPDGIDEVPLEPGSGSFLAAVSAWAVNPGGTWFDLGVVYYFLQDGTVRWTSSGAGAEGPAPGVKPLWHVRPSNPMGDGVDLSHAAGVLSNAVMRVALVDFGSPAPGIDGLADEWIRYIPYPLGIVPMRARRLTLTALGGHLWILGPRQPAGTTAVPGVEYEHRTSLGRDVSVRVSVTGRLSSGHRAVLSAYSERLIRGAEQGTDRFVATMAARTELVVTQPHLDLGSLASSYQNGGREMPFRTLDLLVDRVAIGEAPRDAPSWVSAPGGGRMLFDLRGVDAAGHVVPLRMPLAFLPDAVEPATLAALFPTTGALPAKPEGEHVTLAATPLVLAPSLAGVPDSTSVTVTSLRFGVDLAQGSVLPRVTGVGLVLDGIGDTGGPAVPVDAVLDPEFLAGAANVDQGFLKLAQPVDLHLPTAAIGGVGNPGGVVDRLTVARGLVSSVLGSPEAALNEVFRAPKLFGTIDLIKFLDHGSFDGGLPALKSVGTPGSGVLTYDFAAKLKKTTDGAVLIDDGSKLTLHAKITRTPDGRAEASSEGTVTGIGFTLADAVTLKFSMVRFKTNAGGATSVEVEGVDVEFLGAFEFLAEIARKLAVLGDSGVRVDVDSSGVTAGFDLAVPTIAMGIAQLSNLAISAHLRVPFTKAPMCFTLDVGSRERPVIATVAMFGGGGFLGLEVTPHGLRRLDAALEFGGSVALDILVASGGVSVMAGIYFGYETDAAGNQSLNFSGYVRASGHLSVLGIITVFVEFHLELTYRRREVGNSTHAAFAGRAKVTVGVKVLFFSKTVTLEIEREFIGSAADPTFLDCMDEEDWAGYCSAFSGDAAPRPIAAAFAGGTP